MAGCLSVYDWSQSKTDRLPNVCLPRNTQYVPAAARKDLRDFPLVLILDMDVMTGGDLFNYLCRTQQPYVPGAPPSHAAALDGKPLNCWVLDIRQACSFVLEVCGRMEMGACCQW
jgi:hypothetical protein